MGLSVNMMLVNTISLCCTKIYPPLCIYLNQTMYEKDIYRCSVNSYNLADAHAVCMLQQIVVVFSVLISCILILSSLMSTKLSVSF